MLCPLAPHLAQKSPAEEGAAAIKAWCFFSIKKQKGVYDLFWEKVTHLVHFEYFFCFLFTCGFLGGRSIGSGVRRISSISNIFFYFEFLFYLWVPWGAVYWFWCEAHFIYFEYFFYFEFLFYLWVPWGAVYWFWCEAHFIYFDNHPGWYAWYLCVYRYMCRYICTDICTCACASCEHVCTDISTDVYTD